MKKMLKEKGRKERKRKIKRKQASKPLHVFKFTLDNSPQSALMDDPKTGITIPLFALGYNFVLLFEFQWDLWCRAEILNLW